MILTLPHHDPNGKFNSKLKENLPRLQTLFNGICISISPITYRDNKNFIDILTLNKVNTFVNTEGSSIGDHYRNALKLAINISQENEYVHFGFLDRILFALEKYTDNYLTDIIKPPKSDLLVFERSKSAWSTHPSNYEHIEKHITKMFSYLLHKELDLNFCALTIKTEKAKIILKNSVSNSYNVAGEWIIDALTDKMSLTTKKVDWLSWEDPYWEKISPTKLKTIRENSSEETYKRLLSAAEFITLIKDKGITKLG